MSEPQSPGPALSSRLRPNKKIVFVVFLLAAVGVFIYWFSQRGWVYTNDAQIQGHLVPISPRVSGYVDTIAVNDNDPVQPGQLLVQLDQQDLAARLKSQEANLNTQLAQASAASTQIALVQTTSVSGEAQASANAGVAESAIQSAAATLKAAEAEVTSAAAQAKRTSLDAARIQELYNAGAASKQQLDLAQATDISAQSAVKAARQQAAAAKAALAQAYSRFSAAQAAKMGATTAPQQIAISRAQAQATQARIKQVEADVNNARLALSYTRIAAPVAGVVSQKSVEPGQFVQPGQLIMALVPQQEVWVIANFKETEIGKMYPGEKALISVDTYPGKEFEGEVQSIGAATGASFSLLPSQNSTGNYVKVVQRVPVKIVFKSLPKEIVFRVGLNVEARVQVAK
jgi:membrane fusion protein, multidrug efflux system